MSIVLVVVFLYGLIFGSFLNVVIYRLNTGRLFKGRSVCMTCGKKIAWYDLVPIVSYFILGGKCRNCKSKISIQYPFVELLSGILFVAGFLSGITIADSILIIAMFYILLALSVYDIKHFIIPDSLLTLFSLFAGAGILLQFTQLQHADMWSWFVDKALSLMVPLLFFILWKISKGRWIGFGDIKFLIPLSLFLGFSSAFLLVAFSSWIATLYYIIALLCAKVINLTRAQKGRDILVNRTIPLGPFLSVAFVIIITCSFTFDSFLLWVSTL